MRTPSIGAVIGAVIGLSAGVALGRAGLLASAVGAAIGWFVGRWIAAPESSAPPASEPSQERELRAEVERLKQRVEALERRLAGGTVPASSSEVERAGTPQAKLPMTPHAHLSAEPTPTGPPIQLAEAEQAQAEATRAPIAAEEAASASAPPSGSPVDELFGRVRDWLFGGNTVVRVGVIVLFFGVAFLLKYAYEHTRVPIELRLAAVAAGAVSLLAIGWRLRGSRPGYALALQGGGIGVLYLTLFAAFRLYGLLPPVVALALLTGVAMFSAALAVLQDSRSLAILGASGGFLAPILTSTGGGSHVMLFSYYALLNAGILFVAWHKSWRALNLLGFVFTFVIGALWGHRYYQPRFFATTEPFLALFFLFYVAIPVLFARREAPRLAGYLDGTLVFGVPLVGFGLQLALVRDIEYGAAWSAAALGGFYLALAWLVLRSAGAWLRLLVEAFLALGIGFATLAIPLGFEGRWTAAVWAVEGAALVWVGTRQDRRLARVFGMLLQFAAGAAYTLGFDRGRGALPILNADYLGHVLLALAGLYSAWMLRTRRGSNRFEEGWGPRALFAWGVAWWVAGGLREVDRFVNEPYELAAGLAFVAASCAAFSVLARRLEWPMARYAALAITPAMAIAAGVATQDMAHPLTYLGFIVWPVAFVVHGFVLRREEDAFPRWAAAAHPVGLWLLAALGSWELGWWIDRIFVASGVWRLVAWALVPGALLTLVSLRADKVAWPFAKNLRAYLATSSAALAAYLVGWTLYANATSTGNPAPLPYLPVVNPLDLAQAGALLVVATWFTEATARGVLTPTPDVRRLALAGFGIAAFVWANGVLLRTLHHWAGVPFAFDAMTRSVLVQASFSILWTVIALGAMVTAARRGLRPLWLAGATVMAIVVAKLFVVDLSNAGGIERVVSFLVVGVLMLVIGYFSPVPPKSRETSN
jgi:uncharacterized membrane protein